MPLINMITYCYIICASNSVILVIDLVFGLCKIRLIVTALYRVTKTKKG